MLTLATVEVPEPGPGQARVRVAAAGVNFSDIYERSGVYPKPVPHVPGSEGAGVVVAIGDGRRASARSATGSPGSRCPARTPPR